LRSLIFQLCLGQADIPKGLNELYDESDRGRSNAADEDLSQILFEILNSDEMTYVVIDGLDECPVESERSKMESLLLTPIQEHNVNTNFLFSSRMEFDIEEAMKTLGNAIDLHVIKIAADDVDADVRIHVQRFISGHKRISKWSQAVRQEIENELLKGSQGM
jgi:hypothetical protein